MSISLTQKTLVQTSFAQVVPIADEAAQLFYRQLFTLDPALRERFPAEMAEQRRKLMQTLQVAVNGLNNLDALVPVLQKLAVRHIGYGVRNEHYSIVGEALLWTLAQGLGEGFTTAVREAWIAVYGLISSVMIAAADEALLSAQQPTNEV